MQEDIGIVTAPSNLVFGHEEDEVSTEELVNLVKNINYQC